MKIETKKPAIMVAANSAAMTYSLFVTALGVRQRKQRNVSARDRAGGQQRKHRVLSLCHRWTIRIRC
jgi:hypothetical protein